MAEYDPQRRHPRKRVHDDTEPAPVDALLGGPADPADPTADRPDPVTEADEVAEVAEPEVAEPEVAGPEAPVADVVADVDALAAADVGDAGEAAPPEMAEASPISVDAVAPGFAASATSLADNEPRLVSGGRGPARPIAAVLALVALVLVVLAWLRRRAIRRGDA